MHYSCRFCVKIGIDVHSTPHSTTHNVFIPPTRCSPALHCFTGLRRRKHCTTNPDTASQSPIPTSICTILCMYANTTDRYSVIPTAIIHLRFITHLTLFKVVVMKSVERVPADFRRVPFVQKWITRKIFGAGPDLGAFIKRQIPCGEEAI